MGLSCNFLVLAVPSWAVDLDGSTRSDVHLQTMAVHELHPDQSSGPTDGGPDRSANSVPGEGGLMYLDVYLPVVGQEGLAGIQEGELQLLDEVCWQDDEPVESGIYYCFQVSRLPRRADDCNGDYRLIPVVYSAFNHGLAPPVCPRMK